MLKGLLCLVLLLLLLEALRYTNIGTLKITVFRREA